VKATKGKRKPILLVDDSINSQRIKKLFYESSVDFVEYHIKKFEESCCGELPTTRTPSVIAEEGIFKEEERIKEYIKQLKEKQNKLSQSRQILQHGETSNHNKRFEEGESAYW
jgi:ribosomal protein L12E/L44/L45/RPP1/RPP2